MAVSDFEQLVARHRKYFLTGKTRPAEWREAQLAALQVLMTERAQDDASRSDLLAGATLGAASDKLVALKPIPTRALLDQGGGGIEQADGPRQARMGLPLNFISGLQPAPPVDEQTDQGACRNLPKSDARKTYESE